MHFQYFVSPFLCSVLVDAVKRNELSPFNGQLTTDELKLLLFVINFYYHERN